MVIRAAIDANVQLSRSANRYLRIPRDETLWNRFSLEAAALIRALPNGATALDLGGGRRCAYANAVQPPDVAHRRAPPGCVSVRAHAASGPTVPGGDPSVPYWGNVPGGPLSLSPVRSLPVTAAC